MNEALQLKGKSSSSAVVFNIGRLLRLHLFRRPLTTGWMAGIRIIFRPKHVLHQAEQSLKQKPKPILQSLSTSQKIELGYRVWHAIATNQVDFVSPVPSMQDFKTAIDELHDAHYNYTNGDHNHVRRVIMNISEEGFVEVFRSVMQYVDAVAMGNEEVYLKAGVDGVIRIGL